MKEREALKLALEALEDPWKAGPNGVADAITAIKEVLAQPEQKTDPCIDGSCDCCWKHLDEPKQEPKCNPHPKAPHGFNRNASHANDRYTCECESWDAYEAGRLDGIAQEQAMYEVQRLGQEIQPEQEPVRREQKMFMEEQEFYTAPPQRTWVGLTSQERDEINEKVFGIVPHYVAFHHAIEAKLKEKNHHE